MPFDDEEQATFIVLGFGVRASVVAPESFQRRIGREVAALIDRAKVKA